MVDTEKVFSIFASLQLNNIELYTLQCCVFRNFIAYMRSVVRVAVTVCELWPYSEEFRCHLQS